MDSNEDILSQVGQDFIVKAVRIVVETAFYGVYVLLMCISTSVLIRKGWKSISVIYLLTVTTILFCASSIFLVIDVIDIIERFKLILVDNQDQLFQQKLDRADDKLQPWVWAGEILFIFMLSIGDSIVLWRTWIIFNSQQYILILPLLTWIGSFVGATFELGCDIKTGWTVPTLSAGSQGSAACAKSDTISFSLSFATNVLCTLLIFFKTWQYRQSMTKYLGATRRKTQVEKILTLLVESGAIYIALYTFQAVPIYGGSFSSNSLIAVEAVNAIIQQAMGMYPTVIVVLVEMRASIWETEEVSRDVQTRTGIVFASSDYGPTITVLPESTDNPNNSYIADITSGDPFSTKIEKAGSSAVPPERYNWQDA